ncbi:MAG TPA: hypothetical protein VJW20_14860 [Candidatus Angelobacter sp.]|nr:hypothetical protein [Candidatus Angelobacter sp.]
MVHNSLARMRARQPIPIYENYGKYKPRLNARKIVENLFVTVDPNYLRGLGSVVLSCQGQLRRTRRRKYLSRGRRVPDSRVLGYYRPHWKGQPAFIEIYVDKILERYPLLFLRLPVVGFMLIGKVLFHELGHHLHYTSHPEFKEKEDVADRWSKTLMKTAFRKRYRYSRHILRPIYKLLGFAARRLAPSLRPRKTGD